MTKINTADAKDAALDWLVAKCLGKNPSLFIFQQTGALAREHNYSTDWSQGGPIIEREGISIQCRVQPYERCANLQNEDGKVFWADGPTLLIAAMRCFIQSKLGDTVEVPEELL